MHLPLQYLGQCSLSHSHIPIPRRTPSLSLAIIFMCYSGAQIPHLLLYTPTVGINLVGVTAQEFGGKNFLQHRLLVRFNQS